MYRGITVLLLIFLGFDVHADQVTDFYYVAKRNIEPNEFHRAEYLRRNHGSRFVFNEKKITANALVGISGDDFDDPYTYKDEFVPEWVFAAADLALQVTHWKKMLSELQIPTEVWRDNLIKYEDYQIKLIQKTGKIDPLKNIDYRSVSYYEDTGIYDPTETCEKERRGSYFYHEGKWLAHLKNNIKTLECIFKNVETTKSEQFFYKLYDDLFSYVLSTNDPSKVFVIWEPTCECGNGFFSIAVEIKPKKSSLHIISEFAYKVCKATFQRDVVNDISLCSGYHQLGNGQKVYLAGDYRYQVQAISGKVGPLRAIRLREKDLDSPRIIFSETGHTILE